MDSSDTESDAPPMSPEPRKKRPVPVKALEALAKAREIKAKQREEAVKAKVEIKAKKEEAVKAVDAVRLTTTEIQPPVSNPAPAAPQSDYLKSLEEKLQALESKLVKPKKVKKKIIIEESDSSSDEEVIVKRKSKKKTAPAQVDDSTLSAFKEFQTKQAVQQQAADKTKAENDRMRALFTRN